MSSLRLASVLCPLALSTSRAKVNDERFANFSLCVPLWAMVSLMSWAATAPTLARMRSSSILPWALVIEARTRLSHLFACSRLVAPKIGRGGKIKMAPFLGAFSPSFAFKPCGLASGDLLNPSVLEVGGVLRYPRVVDDPDVDAHWLRCLASGDPIGKPGRGGLASGGQRFS